MNLTSRFVFERESGRTIFGTIRESCRSRLLLVVAVAQHSRKCCVSVGGEDKLYLCLGALRSDRGSGMGWVYGKILGSCGEKSNGAELVSSMKSWETSRRRAWKSWLFFLKDQRVT